jgi:uncharacterized protein with HEPN domain
MRHPERVEDYLGHIVEAIDRATGYLQPFENIEAFLKDEKTQDAVVRNIEIIGEAVTHITRVAPDFIDQHPQLPWARMRGMRNFIAHAYFDVDWRIVWETVKNDLSRLKEQINQLLNRGVPEPDRPSDSSRPRGRRGRRPRRTQTPKP